VSLPGSASSDHQRGLAGNGLTNWDVDADYSDNESLERSGLSAKKRGRAPSVYEDEDSGVRKIEPQQNWLARLFRVKPATRYICLHISKRRARQEVAILLREWRKYGIKDIEVDKDRNIVFARVSAYNCESGPSPLRP